MKTYGGVCFRVHSIVSYFAHGESSMNDLRKECVGGSQKKKKSSWEVNNVSKAVTGGCSPCAVYSYLRGGSSGVLFSGDAVQPWQQQPHHELFQEYSKRGSGWLVSVR